MIEDIISLSNKIESLDKLLNDLNSSINSLQGSISNLEGQISNLNGQVTNLQNNKLDSSTYTANDILEKVKTVDGSGSGLDADMVDGINGNILLKLISCSTSDETGTLKFEDSNGNKILVQYGIDNITHKANAVTGKTLTFPIPFATKPAFFAIPNTSVPYTTLKGFAGYRTSTTSVTVYSYRTDSVTMSYYWLAIGPY